MTHTPQVLNTTNNKGHRHMFGETMLGQQGLVLAGFKVMFK
jgi:hypothetical protein